MIIVQLSFRLTMNRIKRRTWDSLDFKWKNDDTHNFDAPSDIEPDYDSPSIPNNPHTYEKKTHMRKNKTEFEPSRVTSPLNRTIINLTEDGATIQCSYDNNQTARKNVFTNETNRDKEKKTIVVEVHHVAPAACANTHCNFPPPMKKDINSDTTSISSTATLSSAIAEEIQRRKMVNVSIITIMNLFKVHNTYLGYVQTLISNFPYTQLDSLERI